MWTKLIPLKFFARINVYSVRKYVSLIYVPLEIKFASRGNARAFVLVVSRSVGSPVHQAPALRGSGEGFEHIGSLYDK
jgi:hypothetical protein